MTLDVHKLSNDRWIVRERRPGSHVWVKCPNTATFSSRANAMAGKYRYRDKTEGDTFIRAQRQLMKSNPFCVGVFNE